MTPVIYKYAKEGCKCVVLCMNPFLNIPNDFRLQFLTEQCKVKIEYTYKFSNFSWYRKIWSLIICNKFLLKSINDIRVLSLPTFFEKLELLIIKAFYHIGYDNLFKFANTKIFDEKWAEKTIKKNQISALIFDSAMHVRLYNYQAIQRAANRLKVPIVYLPHGLPLTRLKQDFGKQVYDLMIKSEPDYIGVPHEIYAHEHIQHGVNVNKVHTIGSARFCSEWGKMLSQITPKDNLPVVSNDMLKVVYMDRNHGRHGKGLSIASETIKRLSQMDFIKLIIKPHPRSNRSQFEGLTKNLLIMPEANSQNLISWSDVVIGTLSSIIVDVLIAKKTFLFLKYFMFEDENFELPFFGHQFGWEINTYDELKNALMKIRNNPDSKPYSLKQIELFLRKLIYTDRTDYNVLEEYVTWINTIKKRSNFL
jgi:hypothetical protein